MKQFICECGKEYSDPQAFNGHRAHCKIHLANLGEDHLEQRKALDKKASDACKSYFKNSKLQKELKWIEEQHTCEKCGKVMTEKFGSGRFCSRSCANGRPHTEDEIRRISASTRNTLQQKGIYNMCSVEEYYENPNICPICGEVMSYKGRGNKTCASQVCVNEFLRRKQLEKVQNGTHSGWMRRNELSYPEQFWKKVLDNNGIAYDHDYPVSTGVTHYLLDFFIDGNIDLEIDGSQHELPEAVEHDKKRDAYVTSIGFYVYRIKWINPAHDELAVHHQINDFLGWYNNIKNRA